MNPLSDSDLLHAYLEGELPAAEARALEARLKAEPRLAEQLLTLARDEATLAEWARSMVAASANGLAQPPAPRILLIASRRRFVRVLVTASAAAVLLAAGVVFWGRRPNPENDSGLARLDEVQGEVFILLPSGESVAAQAGQALSAGHEVLTGGDGSFAGLRYPDGTQIDLSTRTRLRLEADGGAEVPDAGKRVFLADGFVNADVVRQPEGRPMVLTTPHAVIRVLGTRFSSAALAEATRIDLEEGRVRMTRTSDGKSIEVEEGRYAVAAARLGPAPVNGEQFTPRPLPPRITRPLDELPAGPGPVLSLAVSPDGKMLAAGGSDGTVTLWDREALEVRLLLKGHTRRVRALAFSRDSRLLATGSDDKAVKVWDTAFGEERLALPKQKLEIDAVAFSPDGQTLVTSAGFVKGREGAPLRVWDVRTGRLRASLPDHGAAVLAVAFSPDGRLLASGDKDGTVKLWDAAALTELAALPGHDDWVYCLAFSPDGKWLATGSRDSTVMLWDVAGRKLARMLIGHTREVRAVAFSPDGQTLASGGNDATARLWDIQTGKEMLRLRAHKHAVTGVTFAPDGKTLATCGWDRTVKVWPLTEPAALLTPGD